MFAKRSIASAMLESLLQHFDQQLLQRQAATSSKSPGLSISGSGQFNGRFHHGQMLAWQLQWQPP